jgi:hypothetical protein
VGVVTDLLKEIAGMFLADGRLPVWLVGWVLAVGLLAYAGVVGAWCAALLVAGVLGILAANVLGAARAARKPRVDRPS